ncbi:hypothetical protein [Candidatus Protochlamydia amoebophila]|uniref:Uncharacterized protein n=1 Tax=Protochlamydia amoebophila (strain UWE25) TaxID=264201 RepID=Q6MAQ7_PARUW|nr:hypothetical protein [Candidatus Protochlamydia amoebophila]CAF24342.1 unnamed protein product [Candidatus Protochlamydia amoebophila UWE25]
MYIPTDDCKPSLTESTSSQTSEVQTSSQQVKSPTEVNIEKIATKSLPAIEEETKTISFSEKSTKFSKGRFLCSYNRGDLKTSILQTNDLQKRIYIKLNEKIGDKFINKTKKLWIKVCSQSESESLVKLTLSCENKTVDILNDKTLSKKSQDYQEVKIELDKNKMKLDGLNKLLTNIKKRTYADKIKELELLKELDKPIINIDNFLLSFEQFLEKYQEIDVEKLTTEDIEFLKKEHSELEKGYNDLKKILPGTIQRLNQNVKLTKGGLQKNIETVLKGINTALQGQEVKNLDDSINQFKVIKTSIKEASEAYPGKLNQVQQEVDEICPRYMKLFQEIEEGNLERYPDFIHEIKEILLNVSHDPVAYKDALQTLSDKVIPSIQSQVLGITNELRERLNRKKDVEIITIDDCIALKTYIEDYLKPLLALTEPMATEKAPVFEDQFKNLFNLLPNSGKEMTAQEIVSKINSFSSPEGSLRVYRNFINKNLAGIKKELNQETKIKKEIEDLTNLLKELKGKKADILESFFNELMEKEKNKISELLTGGVEQVQNFVDIFLGHYLVHSQERFPKLLESHRDFAVRVSDMFELVKDHLSEEQLGEIKLVLNDFLTHHITNQTGEIEESLGTSLHQNQKSSEKVTKPAKPLYRKVQGAHEFGDDFSIKCQHVCKQVEALLPWLFGKGFVASPQAAHLVPFPGIVSWDVSYLSTLFKTRLGLDLSQKEIENRLELFNKNVEPFLKTVQANEKVDQEMVKNLLQEKFDNKEINDNFYFIYTNLILLSHLSSLEMSETRHLPEFFNQTMDKFSESEIKYNSDGSRGYKVLLGEAFIDLLTYPKESLLNPQSALSKKHIEYLQATLDTVSERLKQLADEKLQNRALKPIELVECHALHSIYLGVKNLYTQIKLADSDEDFLNKERNIIKNTEAILSRD